MLRTSTKGGMKINVGAIRRSIIGDYLRVMTGHPEAEGNLEFASLLTDGLESGNNEQNPFHEKVSFVGKDGARIPVGVLDEIAWRSAERDQIGYFIWFRYRSKEGCSGEVVLALLDANVLSQFKSVAYKCQSGDGVSVSEPQCYGGVDLVARSFNFIDGDLHERIRAAVSGFASFIAGETQIATKMPNVLGKGRCAMLYRAASSDQRERP